MAWRISLHAVVDVSTHQILMEGPQAQSQPPHGEVVESPLPKQSVNYQPSKESFEVGQDERLTSSSRPSRHRPPAAVKIMKQIKLLLWKRKVEIFNQRYELVKYLGPPGLFFLFMILLYEVLGLGQGGIEEYIVPLAFWIFLQKNVVNIMYEKWSRLQESMRMMGLSDTAYWISYFISDGIILGFLVTFFCCILSTYGLFNSGNFGEIFALLFLFCIASAPFGFFLCSFFDTPQTAGQATLGILLGNYFLCLIF
jgi:hypothetical protein